jgi:hypothetical protein
MTIRTGLDNWTEPADNSFADFVTDYKTARREARLETVFAGLLWCSISFGSISLALFIPR